MTDDLLERIPSPKGPKNLQRLSVEDFSDLDYTLHKYEFLVMCGYEKDTITPLMGFSFDKGHIFWCLLWPDLLKFRTFLTLSGCDCPIAESIDQAMHEFNPHTTKQ